MSKVANCLASMVAAVLIVAAVSEDFEAERTREQQWACAQDAFRLCSKEIPDVSRITACMTRNIQRLSPPCRAQFR